MRGIPSIAFLLGAILAACGGTDEPVPEPAGTAAAIPFARALGGGGVFLSAAGDTLHLSTERAQDGPNARLVRRRAGPGERDSANVLVDIRTRLPIASYRRHATADGDSLVAWVDYGAGFEGQARLTLARGGDRASENLRTPAPYLDAGQIALTLSALDFSMAPDTISFNYVAPFEKSALAARLVLGAMDTLRLAGGDVAAWPVRVQVQGLEEVYWYAAPPGRYRLLRIEEPTRGRVWDRVPDDGGDPAP